METAQDETSPIRRYGLI